jgi:acyl-CoA reductase-like NAD-dependent aldehyde dehydrogenase
MQLMFATGEVGDGYRWLSEMGKLNVPEEVIEDNEDRKVITRYNPLGVVAAIVPWNFPIQLGTSPLPSPADPLPYTPFKTAKLTTPSACGKIAPALLTGNCIIIKPSPFTPYCGLKLAELAQNFFPPGVVQALSGDDNLGPWLTAHPGIDKISFTGSTATGKKVMESAAKTLKRVTLELYENPLKF